MHDPCADAYSILRAKRFVAWQRARLGPLGWHLQHRSMARCCWRWPCCDAALKWISSGLRSDVRGAAKRCSFKDGGRSREREEEQQHGQGNVHGRDARTSAVIYTRRSQLDLPRNAFFHLPTAEVLHSSNHHKNDDGAYCFS
jgi:hypothetical protein